MKYIIRLTSALILIFLVLGLSNSNTAAIEFRTSTFTAGNGATYYTTLEMDHNVLQRNNTYLMTQYFFMSTASVDFTNVNLRMVLRDFQAIGLYSNASDSHASALVSNTGNGAGNYSITWSVTPDVNYPDQVWVELLTDFSGITRDSQDNGWHKTGNLFIQDTPVIRTATETNTITEQETTTAFDTITEQDITTIVILPTEQYITTTTTVATSHTTETDVTTSVNIIETTDIDEVTITKTNAKSEAGLPWIIWGVPVGLLVLIRMKKR